MVAGKAIPLAPDGPGGAASVQLAFASSENSAVHICRAKDAAGAILFGSGSSPQPVLGGINIGDLRVVEKRL